MQKKHHQTNPYGKDMRHENWRISVTGKAKLTSVLLMMLLLTVSVSCCKQREKPSVSGNKADTIATEKKDLLRLYDKKIRQFYDDAADVGMDGVAAMSNAKQVEYTDIAIELTNEALRRMGYKPVDNETARNAIKKYFGLDITASNRLLYRSGIRRYIFKNGDVNERDNQKKAMAADSYEDPTCFWDKLIYVPNYNYIVCLPTIYGVVRIKGLPDIYQEAFDQKTLNKGKLYYDLYDTSVFYENEFIFHDSKKALAWLKKNYTGFLINLFDKYGYDKSDVINKIKLDNILPKDGSLPDIDSYKGLFATKNKAGRLVIHQGLLQYMTKHVNENNLYYSMLDDYMDYVLHVKATPEFEGFTKKERYEIGAYVGYYYGLMQDICTIFPGERITFGEVLYGDHDFVSFIKQHKYFHLKNFAQIIQKQIDRYDRELRIEEHRTSGE